MSGDSGVTGRTRLRSTTTIAYAACGRIERPVFPAPSFQREPDQRANLAQKHAARSRSHAQCAPLPPRALARGGVRGEQSSLSRSGVGGLSAGTDASVYAAPPPTPDPSPPLRGG